MFAFWITKATDTHSEYVIRIAFARQKWLRERASRLRHTYTVCLVSSQKRQDRLGGPHSLLFNEYWG